MEHARRMVSFGPHPAGSPAQQEVGDYIVGQLQASGLTVETQVFETPSPVGRVTMRNIWGIVPGEQDQVLILGSHYDTKLFERFKFVGANDGVASSALLLELARILSEQNPVAKTIWCVFFDGEEAFRTWTNVDSLYGSRHFVRTLKRTGQIRRVEAMILMDLIGGQDLTLKKEANSTDFLSQIVWETASKMGFGSIFTRSGSVATEDDHTPFLQEGVPAVNIIDLSYRYWHTREDTLDKLSSQNLEIVGNVVLKSLPELSRSLEKP